MANKRPLTEQEESHRAVVQALRDSLVVIQELAEHAITAADAALAAPDITDNRTASLKPTAKEKK